MKSSFFAITNALISLVFLVGCEKRHKAEDGYAPEIIEIEAKETKIVNFFDSSSDFNVDPTVLEAMNKLLSDARANGIGNVGLMLVSDKPIPVETQKRAKKRVYSLMNKNGFPESRIVDSGACVYKEAKTGFRIDILKYDLKRPDCGFWSEYIGDVDTSKPLPKYGAAEAYNMAEMIANEADLVSPRKYKGQEVNAAISSTGGSSSGGGSSGGGGGSSSGSGGASS
jgi:pilus biogenesis lipoprotein CpaD